MINHLGGVDDDSYGAFHNAAKFELFEDDERLCYVICGPAYELPKNLSVNVDTTSSVIRKRWESGELATLIEQDEEVVKFAITEFDLDDRGQ